MAPRTEPHAAPTPVPRTTRARPLRRRRPTVRAGRWPIDRLLQLGVLAILVIGAWRVLAPFLPAILFSLVIVSCLWPLHLRLRRLVGGRDRLASLLSCLLVIVAVLAPALLLLLGLAEGAGALQAALADGTGPALPAAPTWLTSLPLVGADLARAWEGLRNGLAAPGTLLVQAGGPARELALASGRALGNAALQVASTAMLMYFLFHHGERLRLGLRAAVARLGGPVGGELIEVARASVAGVMFGAIGAGLAQGALATLGFLVAGVPQAFLLGAVTFGVSILPVGPPLIWAGASTWLLHQQQSGWALFMLLYGVLVISAIDNLLKPVLISRASHLPFVFALIGVIGGALGFGVVGVLLGPTLLAMLADLTRHWLGREVASAAD